jgi:plasmid stability protein
MPASPYIHAVMSQLTIRGVSDQLAERLRVLARERGESVNSTVLALLERALGLDARRERLARYATWTEDDFGEFERALAEQRQVDHDLWK